MSRRLQGALAIAVSALIPAALLATPATRSAAATSAAPYGVVVDRDLRIPMSDGAFLVADVHRPALNGKAVAGRFPVIVSQTPYNKNVPGANMADDSLVEHGYVQVIADVRGTGGSPGTWQAFSPREQRDGKDVVDWAASSKRSWSDGKVKGRVRTAQGDTVPVRVTYARRTGQRRAGKRSAGVYAGLVVLGI